jgi:Flp pilus assembly pilin Flp
VLVGIIAVVVTVAIIWVVNKIVSMFKTSNKGKTFKTKKSKKRRK